MCNILSINDKCQQYSELILYHMNNTRSSFDTGQQFTYSHSSFDTKSTIHAVRCVKVNKTVAFVPYQ